MENVKALVSKKFLPDFNKWLLELESYGYKNFWKVVNATDFGVPQNRERVFCVSILQTDDDPKPMYAFPKGFALDKNLSDMVEKDESGQPKKVEERYYLSDKAMEYFDRVNADKSHNHNFNPKKKLM